MRNRVPKQLPVPDFEPVPRQYRHDGWTPERQRAFIAALAEAGSVKHAAERINMAWRGAYYLRCQPGADSFRAAWEAALDHGVQNLVGIAFERATEGVPIPIFYKGEQCGEKRWYNDRLLMFLLKHHLPGKYGTPALALGTRSRETIEREAAENCPVCRERREKEEETEAALRDPARVITPEHKAVLERIFARYEAKVRGERQQRLQGDIVGADFTVRQLTHIELILVIGGMTQKLIAFWANRQHERDVPERFASPLSGYLDQLRRRAWTEAGEPARPPLPLYEERPDHALSGGPDREERHQAQRAAERRMAEAQAEWEAAARPDTWTEWKAERR